MEKYQTCECCSIRFNTDDTKDWHETRLGFVMCPDCCSNRCDAFPGTCWNKEDK